MRKLGENQKGIIESLKQHGSYHTHGFCGWVWDTPANTVKILESLVKRGLVEVIEDKDYKPYGKIYRLKDNG